MAQDSGARKVSLCFLILAVCFVIIALSSPITSFSAGLPYGTNVDQVEVSYWLYISYAEIAESLVVASILILMISKSKVSNAGHSLLNLVRELNREANQRDGRLGNRAVAALGLIGAGCWIVRTIMSWFFPSSYILGSPEFAAMLAGTWKVSPGLPGIGSSAILGAAVIGCLLARRREGWCVAAWDSFVVLGAPLVLFQQLGLLVLTPFSMVDHLTDFLMLAEGGIQPISNWLALTVSVCLTVKSVPLAEGLSSRLSKIRGNEQRPYRG